MTPIHILDEEIDRCWHAIRVHHATFRNALFRPEATATEFDTRHRVSARLRTQGARDLIALNIHIIRRLKRIKDRIHAAEHHSKTRSKRP